MNLILVDNADFRGMSRVRLDGRRARHIMSILRPRLGDSLRVGQVGGLLGEGKVVSQSEGLIEMEVVLRANPPAAPDAALVLALPRPKCFRRILQTAVTLGIKRIAILGAFRVEKSYWHSPWLLPETLREEILLGMEQAGDTILPEISMHPCFKPFVDDTLPGLAAHKTCLLAQPGASMSCPADVPGPVVLAVGPEGGFTSYEVGRLREAGFVPVSIGNRVLRVEQAVPALLGRILPVVAAASVVVGSTGAGDVIE